MKTIAVALACLALGACATPYQARAWSGGYTEEKLAPDTFEVMFAANAYTDDATARSYLLYRCAELTKQQGFAHFVILTGQDVTTTSLAPNLQFHTKPAHIAKIKLGHGPKPADANAHNADDVLRELSSSVQR